MVILLPSSPGSGSCVLMRTTPHNLQLYTDISQWKILSPLVCSLVNNCFSYSSAQENCLKSVPTIALGVTQSLKPLVIPTAGLPPWACELYVVRILPSVFLTEHNGTIEKPWKRSVALREAETVQKLPYDSAILGT